MTRIHISQLAFPCVTRARGEEAGKKLQNSVETDQIEVDFNDVEMVSLSFLDGFVSNLISSDKENDIVFIVNDQLIRDKLAKIAGMRNTSVRYCVEGQAIRRIKPKAFNSYSSVFMPRKADLRH